jgi:PAS domain S-box-containing protein
MIIWKWIIEHKEDMTWVAATLFATWKFLRLFWRKCWMPLKKKFDNLNYQLNNNGGKSLVDLAQKMDRNIDKLTAVSEGLLMLNDQCIFRCNDDGRCIFANQALCDLYGASREDMMGFGWLNFIKQSEREDAKHNWENAIENDNQVNYKYTVISGDTGEEIKCKYTAVIKRNDKFEIISILGIVTRI